MSLERETPTSDPNGAILMRRIAARDEAALSELIHSYSSLIYSTAYQIVHHKEESEDIVVDVLAAIWERARDFDPQKASVAAWIRSITKYRAIDRLRATQRRIMLRSQVEEEAKESATHEETGRTTLCHADTRKILQSAVYTLSPVQREAVALAFFAGLTPREISERIHQPVGTVKARIHRGVRKLREDLSDQISEECALIECCLAHQSER